ncbi:MAG TPA: class I SAM-dependent methyltransferase [Bryobacteraceae bacterium]|nr:class I SAM-dependent methyltransferase [Bryobacteraceae bacterium]
MSTPAVSAPSATASVEDPDASATGFDEQEYLTLNPDVAEFVRRGVITAAEHWEGQGRHEGRRHCRTFGEWLADAEDAQQATAARADAVGGEPPVPRTLRGTVGSALVRAIRPFFAWYSHGVRNYLNAAERRNVLVLRALRALAREADDRSRQIETALSQQIAAQVAPILTDAIARGRAVEEIRALQLRQRGILEQIGVRVGELEAIQIQRQSAALHNEDTSKLLDLERRLESYQSDVQSLASEVKSGSAQFTDALENVKRLVRSTVGAEHRAWVEAVERSAAGAHEANARAEAGRAAIEQLMSRVGVLEAEQARGRVPDDLTLVLEQVRSELGREVERQDQRLYEIAAAAHSARQQVMANETRVGLLLRELRQAGQPPDVAVPGAASRSAFELQYAAFEDVFRGTRAEIKDRLRVYVPTFEAAGAGTNEMPIVDLGCGRGEWLELLHETGLVARGIDLNPEMVERSTSLGLPAEQGDAIDSLRKLPDASLGAVTTFHMVEHLPFDDVMLLIAEAFRVLRKGGVLLFETPNPNNIFVGARNFYTDPTHRHPLPCGLMRFVTEALGFSDAQIREGNPLPHSLRLPESSGEAGRFINQHFLGPQDYAIVARKY